MAEQTLEGGQKGLVADLSAQHVEDHGSLFEGHRLELGRKGILPAGTRKGDGVVGERAGGNVFEGCPQGVFAAFVLHVHQFAVAGHAVGDPGIVQGAGADLGAPPLVGDGIGQQAHAGLVADARAHHAGQFRRPDRGQRVVGQFDHVEVRGFRRAEAVGEEVEFLGGGLGQLIAGGLVADGEIDLHVAGTRGERAKITAGDHGAREIRAWSS